ncbi:hypothetical protein CWI36_0440p0010 [Hamiltosporidium magnivora]|uniref:Protein-S-isoprenylcysteine O-methyltransferase n=1 Tax=Hamiltosporidium magnivora TaxID=148818 RepID=A0A4Q9LER2_9MICR|nr:hypothetical protein CWI36_0440p0010 [Hamiltosporidium magnivora]
MREKIFYFALGVLFSYGAFYSKHSPLSHVFAIEAFLFFIFQLYGDKIKKHPLFVPMPFDINEYKFLLGYIASEYLFFSYFIPKFRYNIIQKSGAILLLIGFGLMLYIIYSLAFECNKMLYGGLYAHARHPFYVAAFLHLVGTLLYLGNTTSPVVVLYVLKNKFAHQLEEEEGVLLDRHSSYKEYKNNTPSGFFYIIK